MPNLGQFFSTVWKVVSTGSDEAGSGISLGGTLISCAFFGFEFRDSGSELE